MSGLDDFIPSGPVTPIPTAVPEPPPHELRAVAVFTTTTTGEVVEGIPVRVPCDPYYRWYCRCEVIGARRESEDDAILAHALHADEFVNPDEEHDDDNNEDSQT